jgi:HD-GYP domain-containing protein (c-di-GMP phosphodiesterase class II)
MIASDIADEVLIPVSLSTFGVVPVQGLDLYLRHSAQESAVLFKGGAEICDIETVQRMLHEGLTKVYIHRDDRHLYQRFLREYWKDLLNDDRQPLETKTRVLSEVIRDVLSDQFANGTTESIIGSCQTFGNAAANLIGREPVSLDALVSVLQHDYCTFTHSTNVSAYAVLLGRELGFPQEDLEQIAVGGLLHDLGKLDIPEAILNKPGKLTDEEFKEIKTHPTVGLSRVADRSDLSVGQMMMVYQHHERLNGQGYPVGCTGDEIHPWAKLCAIVDVYEAITSVRPYRQPMSNEVALAVLEKGRGTEFDSEMLTCWRSLIL